MPVLNISWTTTFYHSPQFSHYCIKCNMLLKRVAKMMRTESQADATREGGVAMNRTAANAQSNTKCWLLQINIHKGLKDSKLWSTSRFKFTVDITDHQSSGYKSGRNISGQNVCWVENSKPWHPKSSQTSNALWQLQQLNLWRCHPSRGEALHYLSFIKPVGYIYTQELRCQ